MNALAFLTQEAPGFALRGSQIKVITEPSKFYKVRSNPVITNHLEEAKNISGIRFNPEGLEMK